MPNLLRASGPVLFRVLLNGLKGPIRYSIFVRGVLRVKMMRPCMFFRAIPECCECESEILATQRPNMGHLMGRQLVVVCGRAVPGGRWWMRIQSPGQLRRWWPRSAEFGGSGVWFFARGSGDEPRGRTRNAEPSGRARRWGAAAGVVQPVPKTPHFRGSPRR